MGYVKKLTVRQKNLKKLKLNLKAVTSAEISGNKYSLTNNKEKPREKRRGGLRLMELARKRIHFIL